MAFSELELKRHEKILNAYLEKNRPPKHIRNELDLGIRREGQSVEIVEIRPRWDNPQEKMENPVAKATYVKTQAIWKIYWRRADLKWHLYEPHPMAKSLEEFLKVIESDEYGCFFG
ncbi:MAG: DUF3024 domain-containing protein [Chromatiales bacterium]|nr:DUF3024 domain-containing protein [Chromatiales bacterium]